MEAFTRVSGETAAKMEKESLQELMELSMKESGKMESIMGKENSSLQMERCTWACSKTENLLIELM